MPRVAACLPRMGGYTEYTNLPAQTLAPVSDGLDTLVAAALPLDYLTALSILDRHGRARPGDTVLIHGATGGVGDALCQFGAQRRLVTYGTASERTLHRLRDYDIVPIDYRHQDAVQVVREEHPGGVRIVCDPLGGPAMRGNHRLLPGITSGRESGPAFRSPRPPRHTALWNGAKPTARSSLPRHEAAGNR
ncbi:hypothetical protein ABGB14_35655 [Nonomuraea sp. B10E15]|uniref:hypothetical protein n=1 Tax=Nonomuraea sp. B10E15 TaxID=3153560 RepID=UPI00325CDDA7